MWEQHRLGEAASLIESLKSNAHLIIDARNGKNLTHLQSILLFKDSSVFVPTCAKSKLCMSAACRGGFLDDDKRARREFHHRDTEAAKVRKGKLGFLMRGTRLTVFPPWTTIPTAWR